MKNTLIVLLSFVFASSLLIAQQSVTTQSPSRFGIFGGAQFNSHTGNFAALPGAESCCPQYTKASGTSPYFGLLYQLPLASQLELQLRAGYANFNGVFRDQQFIGNALSGTGSNAKVVEAFSEHYLNVNLGVIDISARGSYYPMQKLPLGVDVALHGMMSLSPTYDQHESLITPSGAVFSDTKSTERNPATGDIKNATGMLMAVEFGLHYDIELSSNWMISPEISYVLPFQSPIDFSAAGQPNSTWAMNAMRAGLSLTYAMSSKESAISVPSQSKSHRLFANVLAKQLNPDNSEIDIAKIKVEETLSKQVYPLLPYLFFDEGESTLPVRYKNLRKNQTAQFTPEKQFLFSNVTTEDISTVNLEVYYHLLNVVGSRLKAYPSASITLIGCNRNTGAEAGNTTLSKNRAEAVKEYLTQTWGIEPNRIAVKSQNLPALASGTSVDAEDGHAENSRVEIESSIPEIIDPVVVRDTLRESNPPTIRYRMTVDSDTRLNDWKLISRQPSLPMVDQSGIGTPPAYYDFNSQKKYKNIPKDESPINYSFMVHDALDSTGYAANTMPVELLTVQKKKINRVGNLDVNKYRLIMFDYNSDKLNTAQLRITDKFIRDDITQKSNVVVKGYADRKGNVVSNKTLSENRATTVGKNLVPNGRATAQGFGEKGAAYPNELPEGRMYNRTVEITVSNPIE
ncbi:MAG: OmpA family protein [Ignavibacteria bacterium]|nr:OmpA family protein [Ignavibacteria bacterium]